MSRTVKLSDGRQVDALIEARRHLCTVRDSLPVWDEISMDVNKIVEAVEKLLGY